MKNIKINIGIDEILNFKSLLKDYVKEYYENFVEGEIKIKIIKLDEVVCKLFFEIIERIEVDLKSNILNKYDIKEIEEVVCSKKDIVLYMKDNSYFDSYFLNVIVDEIENIIMDEIDEMENN